MRTWGDLRIDWDPETPVEQRYSLVVIVSDVSRGRMLRLPWDFEQLLGVDPDRMPVADAVRASASIPFFFRPWRLPVDPRLAGGRQELVITDGGMLSSYPIGLFDDDPVRPTIGVKLSARLGPAHAPWRTRRPDLHGARPRGHDDQRPRPDLRRPAVGGLAHDLRRHPRGPLDRLRIDADTKARLFDNGLRAAANFLVDWDYDEWRREYAGALGSLWLDPLVVEDCAGMVSKPPVHIWLVRAERQRAFLEPAMVPRLRVGEAGRLWQHGAGGAQRGLRVARSHGALGSHGFGPRSRVLPRHAVVVRLWRPYAEALAAEFTVHLWDMPGYGQSSKDPDHRVSLDVQGELFADLLEHWDLSSPHVVAHDYGGAVSLRAHLLHGRPYASLALVDVVALAPWGSDYFRLVARPRRGVRGAAAAIHEGVAPGLRRRRQPPEPTAAEPDAAGRAVARRRRAGRVLPADRAGGRALHRRARAAVPATSTCRCSSCWGDR